MNDVKNSASQCKTNRFLQLVQFSRRGGMYVRQTLAVLLLGLPLLLGLASCGLVRNAFALPSSDGCERLRVVSWNVQTFFDAERDGREYEDFVTNKSWGETAYTERLKRLCDCLSKLDADVLALEEVENEAVLQDISNFLCSSWMPGRRYRWAAFAREEGSALGCAVLSRYPLDGLSCHTSTSLSSLVGKRPGLRPLMRVRVEKNGRSFYLIVNHWKSMSGGKSGSEPWRQAQEALLEGCFAGLGELPALACGDFNRDICEFAMAGPGSVLLRAGDESLEVRSPWFDGEGGLLGPGSYYYKEEWSRIDGFLCSGRISAEGFRAETDGPWCYEDTKVPKKYTVWNGRGYSDHLPVSCTVAF